MRYLFATLFILCLSLPSHAGFVTMAGGGSFPTASTWVIEDNFDSDTTANYSCINDATPKLLYDSTNHNLTTVGNYDTNRYYYHTTSTGTNDNEITATIKRGATYTVGIVVRCDGNGTSSTGYYVKTMTAATGEVRLYRFSGATDTLVSTVTFSGSKTWDNGVAHAMRVAVSGSTFTIQVDFNDDGDFDDADESYTKTDSTYSSGAYVGINMMSNGAKPTIDNLKAK